jgi:site-specific DNA recombinase
MGKRAVIYVRTSSEQQAEKCSPVEQEADCRQFAEQQGLTVVNLYRDIERYRVRNRWVEPSGVRYDRPGLLAMLRDAADDQFDVILAWREDRLYRGMRAMLLVLETIQQHGLQIALAQETFDPATAPLKAWLAQVELEHIKERMTMGVKARLRAGKANSGQDRYGYRRVGERIEIVPEEADWVRQIFAWYIARVPLKEMRRRLIAADAPQKTATQARRIRWARSSIVGILQAADAYAAGKKVQHRDGESFAMPIEPILDAATYEAFLQGRSKPRNPAPPAVHRYPLIQGLLTCACGYRWQPRGVDSHFRRSSGVWVKRRAIHGVYYCPCVHAEVQSADCPRSIPRREADREVWRQVCNALGDPQVLLAGARGVVAELIQEVDDHAAHRERIQKELDTLFVNRQWIITRARQGGVTEEEMERMLNEYSQQEVSLKGELSSLHIKLDTDLLVDWEAKVRDYLADLQAAIQDLRDLTVPEEEWLATFDLKRRIVAMLVERVTIDVHRQLTVTIRLDLLQLLIDDRGQGGSAMGGGSWPVGNHSERSTPTRNSALFHGRSASVSVSAIWNS